MAEIPTNIKNVVINTINYLKSSLDQAERDDTLDTFLGKIVLHLDLNNHPLMAAEFNLYDLVSGCNREDFTQAALVSDIGKLNFCFDHIIEQLS